MSGGYRPLEYARKGFAYRGRLWYGVLAFVLYTVGFVRWHLEQRVRRK